MSKNATDSKKASLITNRKLDWKSLQNMLTRLNPTRIRDNVTVYIKSMDEYFPVDSVQFTTNDCDVLDAGHLVLTIDEAGKKVVPEPKKD